MVALPFCHVRLQSKKPKDREYPEAIRTVGDAIRARRLDLELLQKDVARIIGCDEMSIVNWEKNHTKPHINCMAAIIQFLGHNPFPKGDTLAEQIVNHRKAGGMTQKVFARLLGVDPSTLARWERGERKPTGEFRKTVERVLKTPRPA